MKKHFVIAYSRYKKQDIVSTWLSVAQMAYFTLVAIQTAIKRYPNTVFVGRQMNIPRFC